MGRAISIPLLIVFVGGFWFGEIPFVPKPVLTWVLWIVGFIAVTVAVGKGMLGGRRG